MDRVDETDVQELGRMSGKYICMGSQTTPRGNPGWGSAGLECDYGSGVIPARENREDIGFGASQVTGIRSELDTDSEDHDSLRAVRPFSFGRWEVDESGVLYKRMGKGEGKSDLVPVTSTAPIVVANLHDVDDGSVRSLVGMDVGGRWVERAVERDALFSITRVVAVLAPLGANISSANARDVISFLTERELVCSECVPTYDTRSRMGWAINPLGPFLPYDSGDDCPRFDPAVDVSAKAGPFLKPMGTLSEWVAGMRKARLSSTAFRGMLAASFASPLVSVVGSQPFVVYLWGRSRSGKTPTLKAAGSIWGNPCEGTDSYYGTFADTHKSTIRKATLLGDFPIMLDELQSVSGSGGQAGKRQTVENLVYELSLGHERATLACDRSMRRTGSWSSITLATGEIPIVGSVTQQGATNRVVEICAEPFDDVRDAQEMHRFVTSEYGTAGRAFISGLRTCGTEFYRREWSRMCSWIIGAVPSCRHPDHIALIALADALSEGLVFSPNAVTWEQALRGSLAFAKDLMGLLSNSRDGDTDAKAIRFVSEWLVANESRFMDGAFAPSERYGKRDKRERDWVVLSVKLRHALEIEGYDYDKTVRRMVEEGIVRRGRNGILVQRRVGGSRAYCLIIGEDSMLAFLESS